MCSITLKTFPHKTQLKGQEEPKIIISNSHNTWMGKILKTQTKYKLFKKKRLNCCRYWDLHRKSRWALNAHISLQTQGKQ